MSSLEATNEKRNPHNSIHICSLHLFPDHTPADLGNPLSLTESAAPMIYAQTIPGCSEFMIIQDFVIGRTRNLSGLCSG